jgi:hypothetical protein
MWCIPAADADYVACMEDVLDRTYHEVFNEE